MTIAQQIANMAARYSQHQIHKARDQKARYKASIIMATQSDDKVQHVVHHGSDHDGSALQTQGMNGKKIYYTTNYRSCDKSAHRPGP